MKTPKQIAAMSVRELEAYLTPQRIEQNRMNSRNCWELKRKGQLEYHPTVSIPHNITLP